MADRGAGFVRTAGIDLGLPPGAEYAPGLPDRREKKDAERRMSYVTMAGITRGLGIDDKEFRKFLYGQSPDGVFSLIISDFRGDHPGVSLTDGEFANYASLKLAAYKPKIDEMKRHEIEAARMEAGE